MFTEHPRRISAETQRQRYDEAMDVTHSTRCCLTKVYSDVC